MYFGGASSGDKVVFGSRIELTVNNFIIKYKNLIVDTPSDIDILNFDTVSNAQAVCYHNTTNVRVRAYNSPFNLYNISLSTALPVGTEFDFELQRVSNTVTVFLNGLSVGTQTVDSGDNFGFDRVNGDLTNSSMWKGYLRKLEVYEGASDVLTHSYPADGNKNSNWTDQIGSNNGTVYGSPARVLKTDFTKTSRDFSQSTAGSQPLIVENGTLIVENTKPMIDYNGTTDHLRCPASSFITPTTALQVSVVCKNDSATLSAFEILIGQYDHGSNQRNWFMGVNADEKLELAFGDPSNGTLEGNWTSDAVISPANLQTVGFTYNAGIVQLKVNGSNVAGSISGAIPATLYNSNVDATIGCVLSSNSPVSHWNGQILEVYVADNLTDNLDDIQAAQMEAFNIT